MLSEVGGQTRHIQWKIWLITGVAALLAIVAIGCCELVRWSLRERDQVPMILSGLVLGMILWMLAWWLGMWVRQIWRDVTTPRRSGH